MDCWSYTNSHLVWIRLNLGMPRWVKLQYGLCQVNSIAVVQWIGWWQCYLVSGPVMLGLVMGFPEWEVDGKASWWGQVVSWVSQVGRLRRAPSRSDWPGLPSPHWPSGARRQQVTRGHCARCAIALSNDEPGSSRCTIALTRLDLRLLC